MKTLFDGLATGVLVLCALVVAGLAVRREFAKPKAKPAFEQISNWTELTAGGQRQGSLSAPLVIVEFSDYQCPYCRRLHQVIDSAMQRHPGRITSIYRHFPLDRIHPQATTAAKAAECAGDQGSFGMFHKTLFLNKDSLGKVPWAHLASTANVADTAVFSKCLESGATANRVETDRQLGIAMGLRGTPTVFINGHKVNAPVTGRLLDSVVAAARN